MVAPLDKTVVCPVLIGRAPHLESLERLIGQVCSGRGQTALIAGEAGVGKSRLVAETRAQISSKQSQSVLTLQGNCFEPDSTLPYAPLLDLLRAFFANRPSDELAAYLDHSTQPLTRLLPELAPLLPDLASAPALEPEQEKRRLFQALIQFFLLLASQQPLLLIVEDLHWSD